IREAFSVWRNAMEQHGHRSNGIWWLPEGRMYFQIKGNDFKLGLDPAGENWTVELSRMGAGTRPPRLAALWQGCATAQASQQPTAPPPAGATTRSQSPEPVTRETP